MVPRVRLLWLLVVADHDLSLLPWASCQRGVDADAVGAAERPPPTVEQAHLQLTREPLPLPKMLINPAVKNIFDFKFEDFQLVEYNPHPAIKAQVSV